MTIRNQSDLAVAAKAETAPDIDFDVFRQARQGDAESQYQLGLAHASQVYPCVDGRDISAIWSYALAPEKAALWHCKAAQQGHACAIFRLGECWEQGAGVERNLDEAQACYRKAAEFGHAVAICMRQAQCEGDLDAQTRLGITYLQGLDVTRNEREGIRWLQAAAERGHVPAQYWLGQCHLDGLGVERDDAQAAEWLGKAAAGGHATARYMLGYLHNEGRGVPQDRAEAEDYLRLSSALPSPARLLAT